MAKGRRLTVSRSERYLGAYAANGYATADSDLPDFQEVDVWSTGGYPSSGGYDEGAWEPRSSPAPMPPPSIHRQAGGLSLAFEEFGGGGRPQAVGSRIVHQLGPMRDGFVVESARRQQQRQMASSAPMNVPDWNKILRVDSAESMVDSDGGEFEEDRDSAVDNPPHEYLARSRGKNATSVFEGVGRTLKGRDLRRLRDTVWSQTGFDG